MSEFTKTLDCTEMKHGVAVLMIRAELLLIVLLTPLVKDLGGFTQTVSLGTGVELP